MMMTAQETLSDYVDRYLKLSSRYGPDSDIVTDVYGKLRDLLIVEIYFMKSVRIIVHEEELSGFVLYVEKNLRDIVDAFTTDLSQFPVYFKHVMEFRAFSYLREKRRRSFTERAYERTFLFQEEVAERSPEDFFFEGEEKLELERQHRKIAEKLRFVCNCHPSRRRNLFIFLCTLLPYLPSDAIDDFCSVLNCDRNQTFAIADYLCSVQNESDIGRTSRSYGKARKDYFRMRLMELECSYENAGRHDSNLSDEIGRFRLLLSNRISETRKMNVEYPVLGEVLNLEPAKIASAVYYSRRILSLILGKDSPDGYLAKQLRGQCYRKPGRMEKLEPFKAFGIKIIKLPASA